MPQERLVNLGLILFSVSLGVVGQLAMKQGTKGRSLQLGLSRSFCLALGESLLCPYVLLGFALYAVSAVSWLVILSRVELSFAYPMLSIGYVAIVLLSRLIFKERVGWMRITGTLLIGVGVYLISGT